MIDSQTDRCPDCAGVYGSPDLAADPYDYPCCCPWGERAEQNPVLGEQFTQEDGKPGWYSADGLHVLRTTPIRAAFNAPNGDPLYVYPNLDVRPDPRAPVKHEPDPAQWDGYGEVYIHPVLGIPVRPVLDAALIARRLAGVR